MAVNAATQTAAKLLSLAHKYHLYVETFYPLQGYLKFRQTSMLGAGVIPVPDGTGQSPALPLTINATSGHLDFTCLSFLMDFKKASVPEF